MNELKIMLNKLEFRKIYDVTKAASIAESPVKVRREDCKYDEVDAKKLMNLLSLSLRTGDTLIFKSEDVDALNKIRKLLK